MKKNSLLLFLCMTNFIFAQCDGYSQSQCNGDDNCEWVENISYGSCSALSVGECYDYPGECYVDSEPGWYDSSGPYCTGGTYQIDNSYCQEIEMPGCSELDEFTCNHPQYGEGCEWTENFEIEQCSEFDNSESACNNYPGECYWDEDITYGSCSGYSESSCNNYQGCYWDCSWWYSWACSCYGTQEFVNTECVGEYESTEEICEEIDYLIGDMNFDGIINIQDIIQVVNLILNQQYNDVGDMNSDGIINVIDAIQIINIILNMEI